MRRQRVIYTVRDLPASCRPGIVARMDGCTIVTLDSSTTLAEGTKMAVLQLTAEEQQTIRDAFGEPPIGQPVSDFWLSETIPVTLGLIPDSLLTLAARRRKQALALRMLTPP